MIIIFDRELGLRSSRNESCSKWRNEASKQSEGDLKSKIFPKFHNLLFVFYFV